MLKYHVKSYNGMEFYTMVANVMDFSNTYQGECLRTGANRILSPHNINRRPSQLVYSKGIKSVILLLVLLFISFLLLVFASFFFNMHIYRLVCYGPGPLSNQSIYLFLSTSFSSAPVHQGLFQQLFAFLPLSTRDLSALYCVLRKFQGSPRVTQSIPSLCFQNWAQKSQLN